MSSRADACWESAFRDAGEFGSMSGLGLLRHLLADSSCGLVQFLAAEGADIPALRARLESITPLGESKSAFPVLVRRSYEVVPVEVVAGQRDRRQVLHTTHFLWGFASDRSRVGVALKEACPFVAGLSKDSDAWTRWYDAG